MTKEHGQVTTNHAESEGQARAEVKAGADATVIRGKAVIVTDPDGPKSEAQVDRGAQVEAMGR